MSTHGSKMDGVSTRLAILGGMLTAAGGLVTRP